jgi:Kdo2-lipid IVA lauroyltransferase/acyltransferase
MKQLIDKLSYYLIILTGYISCKLTINGRKKMGESLGDFIRFIGKKRRIITFNNIDNAFPDKSLDWKMNVLKDSYRSLCITIVEMLTLKKLNNVELTKYIRFEDINLIKDLHNQGNGIIFISGHFGNWEMLAYAGAIHLHIPMLIIVKPQSNKYIDKHFNMIRTSRLNQVVPADNAALKIFKSLKQGGVVALLADQSATVDKDIYVDFFGRAAATYEAPAELALRFKVPIAAGFAVRQEDGTYIIKSQEIVHDDLEYNPDGVLELTKRHVQALENIIRQYPGQWAWMHRRWKHSPLTSNPQ